MKIILFFIPICICLLYSKCMAQEFHTYQNGLIYKESTMQRLHFIADSLHLRFRKCEIRKSWHSFEQTYGFSYYHDDSTISDKIIKALRKGASRKTIESLLYQEKNLSTDTSLLIRFHKYNDTTNTITIGEFGHHYIIDSEVTSGTPFPSKHSKDGGTWYWKEKNSYFGKKGWYIYYTIAPFQCTELPQAYNEWINYAQCMVDTTTEVFLPRAKTIGGFRDNDRKECPPEKSQMQTLFLEQIKAIPYDFSRPEEPDYYQGKDKDSISQYLERYNRYEQQCEQWEKEKANYKLKILSSQPDFQSLIDSAWKEAYESNCFELSFVRELAHYYDPTKVLLLKRLRRLTGFCSYDSSPRYYLAELAKMAADAGNWPVFLRAHLDLFNDRIKRSIDNSYTKSQRGIYAKELEAMDIDLKQLYPGMLFRIDHAPAHHYYSQLIQTGRAMAGSADSSFYFEHITSIAANTSLDIYNRCIFAYVLLNMIHYTPDENRQVRIQGLQKAVRDFPLFIKSAFDE